MAENDDQGNENTGGGLRKQLEDALAQINTLKEQINEGTAAKRELAFTKAGIDTSSGVGKLLAKTYDGDLDPEEIQAFAEEYGIDASSAASGASEESETVAQTERMDALRQNSRPDASGQKLSMEEWHELSSRDPNAAMQAHADGRVEFPPDVAQQLADNQRAVRLGG